VQPRISNPAMTVPGAMQALQNLGAAVKGTGVPASPWYLIEVRASQVHGCSACVDIHSRVLKAPDERILMVGAWREAPYFNDAKRATLAPTEATIRLTACADPILDEVWQQAVRHYDASKWDCRAITLSRIGSNEGLGQ
jgi:AhpD family alkylhydroperoxidase